MALRSFSNDEMVALTGTWVTADHKDRELLASRPVLAALLPELDEAHEGVLNIQPYEETVERLDEIQEEQARLDVRHDNRMRGIHHRFLSEAYLTDDQDFIERLDDLHALIVPEGLASTQKTYREESGHGQRVSAQLTDDQHGTLRDLATHDGTLHDSVEEWAELAERLGELDRERTGILPPRHKSIRGDNLRARNRWMRIIRTIRTNAELLGDDAEIAALLGRISIAEQQQEERAARAAQPGSKKPDNTTPDDGADNTTPADDAGNSNPNSNPDDSADTASAGNGEESTASALVEQSEATDDDRDDAPDISQ
ncbi:MAG: hypothetical protein MJE77_19405 [Proteobacteria bacterium]|nr:hypothetical protein [Pseudomonadota bacterium]